MARYVDGFLLVVPRRKLAAYRALARKAGKVWMSYGALDYVETVIDDPSRYGKPFAKVAGAKPGEVVVFSWISYRSRAHRNAVNKKVLADPRMKVPDASDMPFDMKRISHAGFKALVEF
jgi:uncharacterized protein YbaA (DUF1428 family)